MDFSSLINKLGDLAAERIGHENFVRLEIYGDSADRTAHIVVYLADNDSWEEHSRAIDEMIDLKRMFLDELAIDYRFAELDDETVAAAMAHHPEFVMA